MTKTKKWYSTHKKKALYNLDVKIVQPLSLGRSEIYDKDVDREINYYLKHMQPSKKEEKFLKSKKGRNEIIRVGKKYKYDPELAIQHIFVTHARKFI